MFLFLTIMNKKGTLISIFQLAESGELQKTEQAEITSALVSFGISLKPQDVDEVFKNIRIGSRHIFDQTEKCIDSALSSIKEINSKVESIIGKEANLPIGATVADDEPTINFIQSLTKDAFNFSEAERLINIARQTIKTHAEKELYSLKTTRIGKTDYITRENFIIYYRDYFKKDGFGF